LFQDLSQRPILDRGVYFVDYVLRQVEVLKFAITWDGHDSDKKWKTTYLDNTFKFDHQDLYRRAEEAGVGSSEKVELQRQIVQELKKYRKEFSRATKQKKVLLALYHKV
jgi:hypothetical protein